ncbi:MAG: TIGR00153 family protein [Pseudomonadota bacterium]|nr:TIGR00153 family protein [Pseudomonadota bacterium]
MTLSSVFAMFAQSPIRPIQEHMETVLSCARELMPFLEDVLNEDWVAAEEHHEMISRLESQADQLKRDLRLHLPKGLFLPVSRTDLLELLTMQDEIANKAEDIAGLMLGRKMHIPKSLAQIFGKFLHRAIDASIQANKAINELEELLETGFAGPELQLVENMIVKLDEIEADTDRIQVELRAGLFAVEKDLNPVDVVFLYKIIEWMGGLADQAQQVGERLLLLVAH